jgi:filamentous hemagglutinin
MERPDHKRTLSNGSSKVAKTYRNTQKKLIDSGRFMDAITMDVVDVQSKFGDKYNGAIAQMMAYATCLKKHGIIK